MKNYLGQTLGLTALVVALLAWLSELPGGLHAGSLTLRKMDIFADVREKPAPADTVTAGAPIDSSLLADLQLADTLALPDTAAVPLGPVPPLDSSLYGRVIEDYTFDQSGLARFYAAVDSIRTTGRKVRVAFYGDSFVEGDIVLGDLRDTLQGLWGGNGVGFLPITSEVAHFKRTVSHNYDHWQAYSVVKDHTARVPFGINGYVYYPTGAARVRYQATRNYEHVRQWSEARLFYSAVAPDTLFVRLNGGPVQPRRLAPKAGLSLFNIKQPGMTSIEFALERPEGLQLYGASLEDGAGFYLDNFSIRGNTGGRLRLLKPEFMGQFDALQRYDLIIVQLGLNAVTNSLKNIKWYERELDLTVKHLRACFPGRPILLVSVADRGGRTPDGGLGTMISVAPIAAMQREVARKHGLLFFDLFRGMGGPGTMVAFSNTKPALANKDFTHLTHHGGKVVGRLFARLFLQEQTQYRLTSGRQEPE